MRFLTNLNGKTMTYENIKLKQDNDDGAGNKVVSVIDPFMQPFVEELALKYPQWVFQEERTDYKWDIVEGKSQKIGFKAINFKVLDKREELGEIFKDRTSNGDVYCVNNFRVSAQRERGYGTKTIHLKKAIKHVDKFFGKKNMLEKVQEAKEQANSTVYQVNNDFSNKVSWKWNAIGNVAKEFLVTKYWEEFSQILLADQKLAEHVPDFPKVWAESHASNEIYDAMRNNANYLVYVDGLSYAIHREKEPMQIKASEELPAFIRRSIGMLKLLEDRQIISGVGLRVNANTFVILEQKEEA
jgi:hypothetical protein